MGRGVRTITPRERLEPAPPARARASHGHVQGFRPSDTRRCPSTRPSTHPSTHPSVCTHRCVDAKRRRPRDPGRAAGAVGRRGEGEWVERIACGFQQERLSISHSTDKHRDPLPSPPLGIPATVVSHTSPSVPSVPSCPETERPPSLISPMVRALPPSRPVTMRGQPRPMTVRSSRNQPPPCVVAGVPPRACPRAAPGRYVRPTASSPW